MNKAVDPLKLFQIKDINSQPFRKYYKQGTLTLTTGEALTTSLLSYDEGQKGRKTQELDTYFEAYKGVRKAREEQDQRGGCVKLGKR